MSGYSHDVANDQASAGGCHFHQVRKTTRGGWQKRIRQSNGPHSAYGPVESIDDETGEANFASAQTY